METIAGFPYVEVQFTKQGTVYDAAAVDALLTLLNKQATTDLIVISHGWNNDMAEARTLYQQFMKLMAHELPRPSAVVARRFAVLGLLWPSKKFADASLIAGGGAASLTVANPASVLADRLNELVDFFDDPGADALLGQAVKLVQTMGTLNEPKDYVDRMQKLLVGVVNADSGEPEDKASTAVSQEEPTQLLTRLSDVSLTGDAPLNFEEGGATIVPYMPMTDMSMINDEGGAAGNLSAWSGLLNGAHNLLNFVTYYQMKERAGLVGVKGLYPLLAQLRSKLPSLKLHLIGHSFGARLVTAATAGPTDASILPVNSLTLLQGAFSHYAFSPDYGKDHSKGRFASVLTGGKVTGPVLISHTHNDKAVGLAYALASQIAGQVGASLGGEDDEYGGIGANGAQRTPVVRKTLDDNVDYVFEAGMCYNLRGDNCITDHLSICQPPVAKAVATSLMHS